MKNKIIAVTASIAMIAAILPAAVFAYDSEGTVDNIHWYIDGTELVVEPVNAEESAEIPDSFSETTDKTFTSAVIKDGIDTIGDKAFYGCNVLENIEIPESVTGIGNYAFQNCYKLSSIEIPSSVTSIGSYTFAYCSALKSIEIPESVTSIGGFAFFWCTALESVEIPSSVKSIANRAFYRCYSLTTVNYIGSEEDWNNISIVGYNELTNATINYLPSITSKVAADFDESNGYEGAASAITSTIKNNSDTVLSGKAVYTYEDTTFESETSLPEISGGTTVVLGLIIDWSSAGYDAVPDDAAVGTSVKVSIQ